MTHRLRRPKIVVAAVPTLLALALAVEAGELVIPGSGNPEYVLGRLAMRVAFAHVAERMQRDPELSRRTADGGSRHGPA